MGTLKALKRRPNNKHRNPCWSQPRKVGATISSNISPQETFDTHEPPRKQLASRRNSESTSRYLRSLLTLGNEGARRYTIAAGKTRPVAPIEKDSAEQENKSEEVWNAILDDTGSRGRENTSDRPRAGTSRRIHVLRKENVGPEEGESGSTGSADPQAAHPRNEEEASYRRQSRTATGGRRGCPGEGLARRTLAAAEHARSTPKSKWRAQCTDSALRSDAPEGVVVELQRRSSRTAL